MRQLTVLGSCGAFPEPGRACSGFAVDWDGFRLVLDLGYATLPRLLTHWPDGRVDAVAITHEHADHCVDLHGLFRWRYYGEPGGPRLPLYCPPGVLERISGLEPDVDLHAVFDVHPLPGRYRVGPFDLTGLSLPHFVPNAGIRLEADGTALAYSGDTGPSPVLAELGRDADLFIVEATDRVGETSRSTRNLLTSGEAGCWARRAGARRLMLTHFWPGNDRSAAVSAARVEFGGAVLAAEEGLAVELESPAEAGRGRGAGMPRKPEPGLAPEDSRPRYQGDPVLLTVDGQDFRVRVRADSPGSYDFDWLSGPHDYGFGVSGRADPPRTRAEMEEHIRAFLAMIDPATGYIQEQPPDRD
ncbi:MBL fold metallo-hydrolase [Micromonospora sp. NPDC126480]|uniref:MBL fold metallo-hydrolase n=1 Tax=Micromonospora sp. NPDC126480 TaxID=3155312 RepID=UPI0033330C3A